MSFIQERLFRMFSTPKTIEDLSQQIQDLRHALNSAVQDIVVLKGVLEEKGLMDAALYKRLRTGRMIGDHSGAGASPWVRYSIYPYTLDEKDFLRQTLGASDAEVKDFEKDVDHMQSLT